MLILIYSIVLFNVVFAGKCPPEEIISPCKCFVSFENHFNVNIIIRNF